MVWGVGEREREKKTLNPVTQKQSRYRPGVVQRVQEVKVPRFHDNSTGWW
jgi:hypothetical protein